MKTNPPLIDSSLLFKPAWQRALYWPFQGPVESFLGLRRINQLYARVGNQGLDAPSFCQAGLDDLGVSWELEGTEHLQSVQGPCVVVANHPLGGREAMILHCILGAARADYRILANPLLGQLPEVRDRLILVDPFETKAAAAANTRPLRETLRFLRQGGLVGIFPAGEVSYWQPAEGRIADKAWAEQAARLALMGGATVVPLHFSGRNGSFFNTLARLHPSLKLPLLPQQLAFGPSWHIRARLGRPLVHADLPHREEPHRLAAWLRDHVHALASQ